jgi:hypothetical protein
LSIIDWTIRKVAYLAEMTKKCVAKLVFEKGYITQEYSLVKVGQYCHRVYLC